MAALQIEMLPCLSDNYGFPVHDAEAGVTAAIDTPEVGPILRALSSKGWRLTHILNTHHHHDHAGGNLALEQKTGCTIVGPGRDAARIPGIDVGLEQGDRWMRFALTVEPGNAALRARAEQVSALRSAGKPTVPTTVGLEKATNPFLRPDSENLRATLDLVAADDVAVFARTRALKNRF